VYSCTFCRGTNTGKRNSSVLYALEFLFPVSKIILKWLRIWSPAITFLKEGIFIWDQLSKINQLMIWGSAITFLKEGIFDSELIIYGIKSTQKGQFMLLGPTYTGIQYGIWLRELITGTDYCLCLSTALRYWLLFVWKLSISLKILWHY
jgi:hypothetical protein